MEIVSELGALRMKVQRHGVIHSISKTRITALTTLFQPLGNTTETPGKTNMKNVL